MSALASGREKYAIARAAGRTRSEAAEAAGVSRRGAYAWEREPGVVARIEALQREITQDAVLVLRGNAARAAQRLVDLMEPGRVSLTGAVNLQAATKVLDYAGLKPVEKSDVTATVASYVKGYIPGDDGEVLPEKV